MPNPQLSDLSLGRRTAARDDGNGTRVPQRVRSCSGFMNAPITIRPLDPSEWRALREIRLLALRTEPGVFFAAYDGELGLGDDEWQRRIAGAGSIIFGLFAGSDLVGITGVVADRDDPTGKTAVLVMSYIRPAYRGRGLTTLFYDARLG